MEVRTKQHTTWRALLALEMIRYGDSSVMEVITWDGPEGSLDHPFDNSYGLTEGQAFYLWTANRVYFPVCYDGAEWVGSVPRNPMSETPVHHGG